MRLAFTVDVEPDYWDPATTEGVRLGMPYLLDALDRLGAQATFFWTAGTAHRHPELLGAVAAAGHEIAAHGVRHEDFAQLRRDAQAAVLGEMLASFAALGIRPRGFRAPRLSVNESLHGALAGAGFSYDSSVPFWGLRRLGYRRRYDAPEGIAELPCIPGYALRLSRALFRSLVERSAAERGHAVVFFHPWELIDRPRGARLSPGKRLNIINTLGTGTRLRTRLSECLGGFREWEFTTCSALVPAADRPVPEPRQG